MGICYDVSQIKKGCEARQSKIRAGSVLAYMTKPIAVITPPRVLVVLRFLLNETASVRLRLTSFFHPIVHFRSIETSEMFG